MRVVWLTDTHFNLLEPNQLVEFALSMREISPRVDAVLITGDISEFATVRKDLERFQNYARCTVWFILGNHDAYGASVREMKLLAPTVRNCVWLTGAPPISLSQDTLLVGVDGWYDGVLGDPRGFIMEDFRAIEDFRSKSYLACTAIARRIAESYAETLEISLNAAMLSKPKKIVVATHVPPFEEAALYQGKRHDETTLPWFCSPVVGDTILQFAFEFPDVQFQVLCGHTHCAADVQIAENLRVLVGAAECGKTSIAGTFDF